MRESKIIQPSCPGSCRTRAPENKLKREVMTLPRFLYSYFVKLISHIELLMLSSALLLSLQFGCKDKGTEIDYLGEIEFLGFDDKFALRMVLEEPYLYVCAGSDGVWRRNVRGLSNWEYLGLRDTTLGKYTNVGALDIDVLGQEIIVAYNGTEANVPPSSIVSIWRSSNAGITWFRSDSGIPETINDSLELNGLTSLQRSPHQAEILISWIEPTSYLSTNGGNTWALLSGQRGVIAGLGYVRWHPYQSGEAWFFGETALFAPYCFALVDYGLTGKIGLPWDSLGCTYDGAVYDIAFDAGNSNIVYAASSCGILKTNDGGYVWQKNAVSLPDNGFVFRMTHHSSIGGTLYLAGGRQIYATFNSRLSVQKIGEIERGFITSLVWDLKGNQLFVGTTEGGIYVLKFNGR